MRVALLDEIEYDFDYERRLIDLVSSGVALDIDRADWAASTAWIEADIRECSKRVHRKKGERLKIRRLLPEGMVLDSEYGIYVEADCPTGVIVAR